MKTNYLKFFLGVIAILGITFWACETTEFDPDSATAQDNARAEGSIIDVFGLVSSNADEDGGGEKSATLECYTVDFSRDTASGIRTLIITFDSLGCEIDGSVYRGQINTAIDGNWFEVGSTMTTTFNNFSKDSVIHTGTMVATYTSNDNLTPIHNITATNMKLEFPNGKTITWTAEREIKWLAGYLTRKNRADDKLQINGTLTGVNKAGENFTSVSTNLIKEPACQLFVSGTIVITKGLDIINIDFGDGECDGEFTVTQNNYDVVVKP